MSHVTTNKLMNLVGAGHDILVKNWRDRHIAVLKEKHVEACLLMHSSHSFESNWSNKTMSITMRCICLNDTSIACGHG